MISCDRSPLEIAGYCIASVDGTMTVLVNKSKQTTSKTTNLPPTGQILTPNESKMRPVGGRLVLASLLDLYLEDSILPRQLDSPVAYQPISHGMAVWGAMKILRDSWDSIQWLRYARSARAAPHVVSLGLVRGGWPGWGGRGAFRPSWPGMLSEGQNCWSTRGQIYRNTQTLHVCHLHPLAFIGVNGAVPWSVWDIHIYIYMQ